jgi:hypothetical protein
MALLGKFRKVAKKRQEIKYNCIKSEISHSKRAFLRGEYLIIYGKYLACNEISAGETTAL